MAYPLITQAQVISQDPTTGGLNVVFPSGQMSAYPVKFGYHGPADGVRINHPALPGRGTWGVVVFPGGDNRAGVWIASIYTQMVDARTTNTDPFIEYNAHQSGFYEILDGSGNHQTVYPDGTMISVADGPGALPTYRHVVDAKQFPQLQAFTQAERVPAPPGPFYVNINTASGVSIQIDNAGNVSVNVKNGQAVLDMTAAGVVSVAAASEANVTAPHVTVNGDQTVNGSLTVTGNLVGGIGASGTFTAGSGQNVTVQNGIVTNIY